MFKCIELLLFHKHGRLWRMYIEQCVCTQRPHQTCSVEVCRSGPWCQVQKNTLPPACLPVSMPHHRVSVAQIHARQRATRAPLERQLAYMVTWVHATASTSCHTEGHTGVTAGATQTKRPCSHPRDGVQGCPHQTAKKRIKDAPHRPHRRRNAATSGCRWVSSRPARPRAAAARRPHPHLRRRTPTRAQGRKSAPRPPPACPVRRGGPSVLASLRTQFALQEHGQPPWQCIHSYTRQQGYILHFSARMYAACKAHLHYLTHVTAGGGTRACTTPCPTFRMCPRRPARRQQRTTASRSTSGGANSSMGSTLPCTEAPAGWRRQGKLA
jgi:hypothetical protein